MPETYFYLTYDEHRPLVKFLLDTGAIMIPSIDYESDKYLQLTDVQAIMDLIERDILTGPIFVMHPSFTMEHSPAVGTVVRRYDGRQIWFLHQRSCGPYMDFSPCRYRSRDRFLDWDGPARLVTGDIGHYPSFYMSDRSEMRAPPALKRFYKDTVKFLQTLGKCVVTPLGPTRNETYIVGPAAHELIVHGVAANPESLRDTLLLDDSKRRLR